MGDQEVIDRGIRHAVAVGKVIDDRTARVIASAWHGGQWSALYSLASSGAVDADAALSELRQDHASAQDDDDMTADDKRRELGALMDYVSHVGDRGPVQGWSGLNW